MLHNIKHHRSQALIDWACEYATDCHGEQKRKYTNEPYITHPIAVAEIVASVTDDCETIAAAFLHDVVEDCGETRHSLIEQGFGPGIADLVLEVSDISKPEDGNRAIRKAIDLSHLAKASFRGQTIKLADLIHNSDSILQYAPGFARIYMAEKAALLKVLTKGNSTLYNRASVIVDNYYGEYK